MKKTFPNRLHTAALYAAQVYQDAEMEAAIWQAENDVDVRVGDNQCTVLGLAATMGYTSIVRILLEAGANPDLSDDYKYTPLMEAVSRKCDDVVKLLLDARANIDLTNLFGETALMRAGFSKQAHIIEMIQSTRTAQNGESI